MSRNILPSQFKLGLDLIVNNYFGNELNVLMGALDVAASSSFLYMIRFISSCFFSEGPKQDLTAEAVAFPRSG